MLVNETDFLNRKMFRHLPQDRAEANAQGADSNGAGEPVDDHNSEGGPETAHDEPGHDEPGHDEPGHETDGHDEPGHDDHAGHSDPLAIDHLLGHVSDSTKFEYSGWLVGKFDSTKGGGMQHYELPETRIEKPVFGNEAGPVKPFDFQVTKFMVIEVLVAFVLIGIFVPLGRRIQAGGAPKGKIWNLLEVILQFVRDQVARPSIGKHDADRYLPYLWTVFFFILGCNLFGLIPAMGSPTGSLAVTGVLAMATMIVVFGTGFKKMGVVGFFKAQVPHMDLPLPLALVIIPMIFVIEIFGLLMKHFVLALRLFANMFAGHIVIAVLLAFITMTWGSALVYAVAPASIGASVAIYLLELFVAFLQAYIFTFLSALFIGAAVHPH